MRYNYFKARMVDKASLTTLLRSEDANKIVYSGPNVVCFESHLEHVELNRRHASLFTMLEDLDEAEYMEEFKEKGVRSMISRSNGVTTWILDGFPLFTVRPARARQRA